MQNVIEIGQVFQLLQRMIVCAVKLNFKVQVQRIFAAAILFKMSALSVFM